MILRINYFTFILLWLAVVLAAPIPLPETPQNGALKPRSNFPRDAPSVATKDGPPDSAKIATVKQPGEKLGNSPQNSAPFTPMPNFAGQEAQKNSQESANYKPASKNGSPSQPEENEAAAKPQNSGQDSKHVLVQGHAQGEPAVGRVPDKSNSSPPAGQNDRPPQNQQAKDSNPPPAKEQTKPESKKEKTKEKPKIIYMPMPKIQLFGRPHEGQHQYVAG